MSDSDITNVMILNAIQDVKQDLHGVKQDLRDVEKRITQRIASVDAGLTDGLASLQEHLERNDRAFQRLFERRTAMAEDIRIIKEEELPAIKAHIGLAA